MSPPDFDDDLDADAATTATGDALLIDFRGPDFTPLHQPALHESGFLHASGQATYVDDLPDPLGTLHAWPVVSPVAHGTITRLDTSAALQIDGVEAVLTASDIPGINDVAPFTHDEPLLAANTVCCVGQRVALVLGRDLRACRQGAAAVVLEIAPLPAVLTLRDAIDQQDFLTGAHVMRRGDVDAALASAHLRLSGEVETGGQDHFYLETHAALAIPQEDRTYLIHSSTQHPSEVQAKVAEALALPRSRVVVETRRMGGGFGGKETQGAHLAVLAALGARVTGRPVRFWLNRDQDMTQTGGRHPFLSRYEAGFSADGDLLALRVHAYADGGWSCDLSGPIRDRCLFHLDNSYYIPNLHFEGRVARTHTTSNTAFRGFGGPQGMVVVEAILTRAAQRLGIDPADLRSRNYYGSEPRDLTPYGQPVLHNRLPRITSTLLATSDYAARRAQLDAHNAQHRWLKRGIAFQPVKFGISFTNSVLNQAGALVLIYADGAIQLNHGGTEMGQGLHTKMIAVCAHTLGVRPDTIRVMPTATDKVPNTSATAASAGSDLNGQAVKEACDLLRDRLVPIAAGLLGLDPAQRDRVRFADGFAFDLHDPDAAPVPFADVAAAAYAAQVSLSAAGFYRTPNIAYDPVAGRGKPFHYFAFGAAVVEVEVNGLTGEHRLTRVDILHDVGSSLVPTIDRGQVEGGFIQGYGWLTCEELVWSDQGHLRTHSPDTYKVPALGEAPDDFRVALLDRAPQDDVIYGSKAVGEPPFMLAIGTLEALRHAVCAFAADPRDPRLADLNLRIPCTPEAVLRAVEDARTGAYAAP